VKILKDGQEVGNLDEGSFILATQDDELRQLYALLKKQGIETLALGPRNIDLVKYIPVGINSLGLLANALSDFGYETQ
jgi:hypothetical protein